MAYRAAQTHHPAARRTGPVLLDRPASSSLLPAPRHPSPRVAASRRLRQLRDAKRERYRYRDDLILHDTPLLQWIDFARLFAASSISHDFVDLASQLRRR